MHMLAYALLFLSSPSLQQGKAPIKVCSIPATMATVVEHGDLRIIIDQRFFFSAHETAVEQAFRLFLRLILGVCSPVQDTISFRLLRVPAFAHEVDSEYVVK